MENSQRDSNSGLLQSTPWMDKHNISPDKLGSTTHGVTTFSIGQPTTHSKICSQLATDRTEPPLRKSAQHTIMPVMLA
jgi:hypothetical protein